MALTAIWLAALLAGTAVDESAPDLSRAAQPKGNPSGWFSGEDYPGQTGSGTARFTLVVGTDGKTISCVITSPSGLPGFDALVCAKMTSRARFKPATDRLGRPTVGQWSSYVRFGVGSADILIN